MAKLKRKWEETGTKNKNFVKLINACASKNCESVFQFWNRVVPSTANCEIANFAGSPGDWRWTDSGSIHDGWMTKIPSKQFGKEDEVQRPVVTIEKKQKQAKEITPVEKFSKICKILQVSRKILQNFKNFSTGGAIQSRWAMIVWSFDTRRHRTKTFLLFFFILSSLDIWKTSLMGPKHSNSYLLLYGVQSSFVEKNET